VFSTPTVAGDVLLIGSCAGTFYAFDKRSGKVRWSYDIHQDGNQTSFHGNPLITDQLVLIGTDKSCASGGIGHVYAFDRATGTVRWKYRTAGTPTDIARIGSTIYAASFVDELSALNLADGTLRWKFATGTSNPDCALPPAPVVVGDRVVYAGLNGILYGFDAQSGKVLWKHDLGKRPTTKLSVVNNSVYVGNSTKRLFRISADDGHLQSTLSVPASPAGRFLVDADALYIFLEDNDIQGGYLIRTDLNLSQISWTRKADRAWSSEWPRLWNGLLLAGNCRSELDAFRISDGAPQWSDRLRGCLRSIGTDADSEQIYVGAQEGTVYAYSPPLAPSRDRKH
jgi:outer membrane protein assembly factor BamB